MRPVQPAQLLFSRLSELEPTLPILRGIHAYGISPIAIDELVHVMHLVYFRHPDLCLRVLQSSLDSLGIPRTGSQRVDPGPAVAHRTVALASGVTTRLSATG